LCWGAGHSNAFARRAAAADNVVGWSLRIDCSLGSVTLVAMLLNRALEAARELSPKVRLLRERACAARERLPLVLVPSMFGTRLQDGWGQLLWGRTRALYFGPPIAEAHDVEPAGLLFEFRLLPGVFAYDVLGGLVRFLQRVAGYRLGEDLFLFEYDWRSGVVAAARELARLVDSIRGIGSERVDLVGISSGGLIVRYYVTHGGADVVSGENSVPGDAVRRSVYVGTPHRGTLAALSVLERGFAMAPRGRWFQGSDAATLQLTWDLLPHPDDAVFCDERGHDVPLDLYDTSVWQAYFASAKVPGFERRLERAARLHRSLDARPAPESFVIGARHLPTPIRMLAAASAPKFWCCPDKDGPVAAFTWGPGDGSVPESSARAVVTEAAPWFVKARVHHALPSHPLVHRFIVEALLATDRHIPKTTWRTQPALSA
jgi:hypothetical protein